MLLLYKINLHFGNKVKYTKYGTKIHILISYLTVEITRNLLGHNTLGQRGRDRGKFRQPYFEGDNCCSSSFEMYSRKVYFAKDWTLRCAVVGEV